MSATRLRTPGILVSGVVGVLPSLKRILNQVAHKLAGVPPPFIRRSHQDFIFERRRDGDFQYEGIGFWFSHTRTLHGRIGPDNAPTDSERNSGQNGLGSIPLGSISWAITTGLNRYSPPTSCRGAE